MLQPFVGEIRMFAGSFAPQGWSMCDGQLLPISENEVLFNLIGTIYGGDGQSTFALPDLQSRAPVDDGQGPGLPNHPLGEQSGAEAVTLTVGTMAAHAHGLGASTTEGVSSDPAGRVVATSPSVTLFYDDNPNPGAALNSAVIQLDGGGQPHENIQPYLVVNHIISLFGAYPPPS